MASLAFFPDGKTLAAGSEGGIVRLWNLATRKAHAVLPQPGATGADRDSGVVAISPDGGTLAYSRDLNFIDLWNVSDATRAMRLQTASPSRDLVYALDLEFSPAQPLIAWAGFWRQIQVWDTATGEPLKPFEGHANDVNCLVFSRDGQILASGSRDNTVKLWRVEDRTILVTLTGHAGWVTSVALSPDEKTLASAGNDCVKLWNLSRMPDVKEVMTLPGQTAPYSTVAFSPDGTILAAYGEDKILRLWRAPTFTEIERTGESASNQPP